MAENKVRKGNGTIKSMEKLESFEDLKAWQEAHKLVISTYEITRELPSNEQFGLVSQMRRCSVSVSSNIAEGFARQSKADKKHFYVTARGSLSELRSQTLVLRDVYHIDTKVICELTDQISSVYKLLHGLIKVTDNNTK